MNNNIRHCIFVALAAINVTLVHGFIATAEYACADGFTVRFFESLISTRLLVPFLFAYGLFFFAVIKLIDHNKNHPE